MIGKEHVYNFLAGLNNEYGLIRVEYDLIRVQAWFDRFSSARIFFCYQLSNADLYPIH